MNQRLDESSEREWPPALAPAHETLSDAHETWHEAADAYDDPPTFRRRVDALIQGLRNVTWRLQSYKNNGTFRGAFDQWYEPWQTLMKKDKVLRWLNDARVDIVKKRGLTSNSYALVKRIDSYLEPSSVLLRLSPDTPTKEVVSRACEAIPTEYQQYVAVQIVRRWSVDQFPTEDLLDVLSYCFRVLDATLKHGYELLAGNDPVEPGRFLEGVRFPRCMLITPSLVPRNYEADTGDEFAVRFDAIERDEKLVEVSKKRYGSPELASSTAIEFAEQLHGVARTMFKKDGNLAPNFHLRYPEDGRWQPAMYLPFDKRSKFMIWHGVGQRVLVRGYDAVITSSEVWMAFPPKNLSPYPDVEHMPGRREGIVTWAAAADGSHVAFTSEIYRVLGKGFLKPMKRTEESTAVGFFTPVRAAWTLRASREKARPSAPDDEGHRDATTDQGQSTSESS